MAVGDNQYKSDGDVVVDFDARWGRYHIIHSSNLTKTALYYLRDTDIMDYEWGWFIGFHKYWL